jgi:lactate permease
MPADLAIRARSHEGTILRFVFWHSIALACLAGLLVIVKAYLLCRAMIVQ